MYQVFWGARPFPCVPRAFPGLVSHESMTPHGGWVYCCPQFSPRGRTGVSHLEPRAFGRAPRGACGRCTSRLREANGGGDEHGGGHESGQDLVCGDTHWGKLSGSGCSDLLRYCANSRFLVSTHAFLAGAVSWVARVPRPLWVRAGRCASVFSQLCASALVCEVLK